MSNRAAVALTAAAVASVALYVYTQRDTNNKKENKSEKDSEWGDLLIDLRTRVSAYVAGVFGHAPTAIESQGKDSEISPEVQALYDTHIESAFSAAADYFSKQNSDFTTDDALTFYALYKQACSGDCDATEAELQKDIKKRAWLSRAGEPSENAKKRYVNKLINCVPSIKEIILGAIGDTDESPEAAAAEIGFAKATLLRETLLVDEEFGTPEEGEGDPAVVNNICAALKDGDKARLISIFQDRSLLTVPIDTSGSIALHVAADRGLLAVVKLLVEYGTSVNVQNKDGDTPLHCAVIMERLDVCEFLLAQGADATLRNVDGEDCTSCLEWFSPSDVN